MFLVLGFVTAPVTAPETALPPLASFRGFKSRTLMCFFDFLVAILVLLSWVVCYCCLCWSSGTEQQLTPADDIFLWN